MINHAFLKKLRILAIVEGTSTLILFGIAMPLKYLAGIPEAVRIVGSIHGALFVALVAMFAVGMKRVPIPPRLTALGIFAAVVPFGPFVVDRRLGDLNRSDAGYSSGE